MKPPNEGLIADVKEYINSKNCRLPNGIRYVVHDLCNYTREQSKRQETLAAFARMMLDEAED